MVQLSVLIIFTRSTTPGLVITFLYLKSLKILQEFNTVHTLYQGIPLRKKYEGRPKALKTGLSHRVSFITAQGVEILNVHDYLNNHSPSTVQKNLRVMGKGTIIFICLTLVRIKDNLNFLFGLSVFSLCLISTVFKVFLSEVAL